MKHIAIGIAAILSNTAFAQLPPPQAGKIAPAAPSMEDVLSSRGAPAPLAGKRRLEVYGQALATPKALDSGELGAATRITTRDLYVNASTYAWVKRGTVAPAEGASGVSQIFARADGNQSMLEIHFRAAAAKQYVVDCTIIGQPTRINVNNSAISTVEGHLVAAVPATAQARGVVLQLTSDRAFQWSACEIVPVNR